MRSMIRSALVGAAALLLLPVAGCGTTSAPRRYDREEVQEYLQRMETPGLVIGEFPLAADGVVDGDTVKVAGLRNSLRLLAIDTEETFKDDEDRRLLDQGWEAYRAQKLDGKRKPVKAATPLGEEAKDWAAEFFKGADLVRLERDHPKEIRGYYGRYLSYVFARKEGEWVNYNVECVRAGMSPYFTKYGYSRRFHDELVQAQDEARAAKRGIWAPDAQGYPDYEKRLEWWDARAAFAKTFEDEAEGKDNYVVLTRWDSLRQLEANEGNEVHLLGLVGSIRLGDKGPTKAMLSRRMFADFPLIFFDKDVFGSCGISNYEREFVRVRGTVTRYKPKDGSPEQLQIVVNMPGQIIVNDKLPEFVRSAGIPESDEEGPEQPAEPSEASNPCGAGGDAPKE